MTMVVYTNPNLLPTLNSSLPRRRRLAGPAHHVLRAAIENADSTTKRDRRITANVVGDDIIDVIDKLSGERLRVLATVVATLVR